MTRAFAVPVGTVLLYCGQRWRVIGSAHVIGSVPLDGRNGGTYMCQLIAEPGEPQAISCWPAELVETMALDPG